MDIELLEELIDLKIKLALRKEKNQEPSKYEKERIETLRMQIGWENNHG